MQTNRSLVLLLGDILALASSFFLMLLLRFGKVTPALIESHTLPFTVLYIIWLLIFYIFDLYELKNASSTIHVFRRISYALITALVVGIIFFYLTPFFDITPKTNLFLNILLLGILFLVWRRLFSNIFASSFTRLTLLIGNDKTVLLLQEELANNPQRGFTTANNLSEIEEIRSTNLSTIEYVVIPSTLTIPPDILHLFYTKGISIIPLEEACEHLLFRIPLHLVDETWFVRNIQTRRHALYSFISRVLGSIIAVITLLITLPITLITALFIKLEDGGPIFYMQTRVGRNKRPFNLYKFRSMVVDAEKDGAQWASQKDTRVTRIGRIIRKLHIDEIPQMLNIIKGDIALVGPRPERPEFVEKLEKEIPHYTLRHIVNPGFTGWAQIKHHYARSKEDSHTKYEYDLYYVKNRNFVLDLAIILKTIQIIFTHR